MGSQLILKIQSSLLCRTASSRATCTACVGQEVERGCNQKPGQKQKPTDGVFEARAKVAKFYGEAKNQTAHSNKDDEEENINEIDEKHRDLFFTISF